MSRFDLLLIASSLKRYVSWNIAVQIGSNDSKGLVGNVELEEAGALLYSALQVRHYNEKTFLHDADNAENMLCTNTYILIVSWHNQYQMNIFAISECVYDS